MPNTTRLARRCTGASLLAVASLVAGCTSTTPGGVATPAAGSGTPVTVTAGGTTATARSAGKGADLGPEVRFLSELYAIGPAGPLPSPATVRIQLAAPAPPGDGIVVATRTAAGQPWDFLPATPSADRTSVSFTTAQFSEFGVLDVDVAAAVAQFKGDLTAALDGGASQDVAKPRCDNEKSARNDGYTVTASSSDALYWCLGRDSSGARVVKVADHRGYPLVLAHPGFDADQGRSTSLSHLDAGSDTVVGAGGTAVFSTTLRPGGSATVRTRSDGLGQSLFGVRSGVTALTRLLTRFGAGAPATDPFDKVLGAKGCAPALSGGSSAVLAGCFGSTALADAFGTKGLLLAPVVAAPPVTALFDSQWQAATGQLTSHAAHTITVKHTKPSVTLAAFAGQWVGHTRRLTITTGGAATESIGDGCCDPIIDLSFTVSAPGGTAAKPTATMTVTSVTLHDWPAGETPPKVGDKGTLTISGGVITEPVSEAIYCNQAATAQSLCGA